MSMFRASRRRERSPSPPPPSFSRRRATVAVREGSGSASTSSSLGRGVDMEAVRRRSVIKSKALPPPPHPAINPPKKKVYRVFDLALREEIAAKRKLTDVVEKSKARQPPGLSVTVPYDRYHNVKTKKQRERIDQEAERAKWVGKKRESLFADIDLKKPSGPMEVGEKDPPPGLASDGTRQRSPSPPPEPFLHSEDREENRRKIDEYGMPSSSPFFKVTDPADGESAIAFLVRQLKEAKVVRSLANERVKIIEERILAQRRRRKRRKEGETGNGSEGSLNGTEGRGSQGRMPERARVSRNESVSATGSGRQVREGERGSSATHAPRSSATQPRGRGSVREGSNPSNPLKRKRDSEDRQRDGSLGRGGPPRGGRGMSGNVSSSSRERRAPPPSRRRREEEEEESDSFIAEDGVEDESGIGSVYDRGYSAFISTLGFSRGPTSIDTYRNLGGKMSLADEMALTDMEKVSKGQRQYDDKRDSSRGAVSATITDREERERERQEKRRKKQ